MLTMTSPAKSKPVEKEANEIINFISRTLNPTAAKIKIDDKDGRTVSQIRINYYQELKGSELQELLNFATYKTMQFSMKRSGLGIVIKFKKREI